MLRLLELSALVAHLTAWSTRSSRPKTSKAPAGEGAGAAGWRGSVFPRLPCTNMLNRERLFSRLRSRLATAASRAVSPRAEPPRYSIIGSALSRHAG